MKNLAAITKCPDCGKTGTVMGMATGNIKIFGCISCRNAQGRHLKMSEAKKAWKKYQTARLGKCPKCGMIGNCAELGQEDGGICHCPNCDCDWSWEDGKIINASAEGGG